MGGGTEELVGPGPSKISGSLMCWTVAWPIGWGPVDSTGRSSSSTSSMKADCRQPNVGHGWVSGCKIDRRVSLLYFQVDDVEGPLVLREFFLQKLGLQARKPCTRTQMKQARFGLPDICSSDGCKIRWMSLSEGSESLFTSLTCSFISQVVESSMKIV